MHTLLIRIGQILERRASHHAATIVGLSYSEVCMLHALSEGGERGLTRADLADQVHLTPSAVSRALKPMEKLGFTEDVRDERDARNTRAVLTEAGEERLGHALSALEELWHTMDFSVFGLNADQLGQTLDFLAAPRPRIFGARPLWAQGPTSPPTATPGSRGRTLPTRP